MEATLLTDRYRLQEIYDLRVIAYENSPYATYINWQSYPNGYFDELDPLESTHHWIVEDKRKIVGSVRAAMLEDFHELHEDLDQLGLPEHAPFAFCGRTAVHPLHRNGKVMLLLDHAVIDFLQKNSRIQFALCYVIPERANAVKRLGFRSAGFIHYEWMKGVETTLEAFVLKKQY
jgi:hypothetical protein